MMNTLVLTNDVKASVTTIIQKLLMKFTFIIFLSFFHIISFSQAKVKDELSLNGEWKFKTDPTAKGEELKWFSATHSVLEWDSLKVPGNWDLRNEYAHYVGKAWYRKDFTIGAAWKNKVVRLLFQGVNWHSKIWVNGKLAGTNNIGYLPFEMNISSFLNYPGRNIIVVEADNSFRVGALWNWGGIRRPVTLVASEKIYIVNQYITPIVNLQNHTAKVAVKIMCKNSGTSAARIKGEVTLSAVNGFKKVMPFTALLPSDSSTGVIVETNLSKDEVHLWSSDDPFLYQSKVSINNDGEKYVINRFGLRKIEIDNKNYSFKVNGVPIRPVGFNLVPDDRTTGSTLPLWRVKEDVDLMKSLGANVTRLTHVPIHEEMFDYLDEKGIIVFSEIPLWGLDQLVDINNPLPNQWLQRLINNNYNHPCIIGWSVGNEIGVSPGVMEYVEDAIDFVKKTDTSRLAVMISHTANRPKDAIQYSDLGLVNSYGTGIGRTADKIHNLHPGKLLFYSEFGYGQLNEDLDADVDARGMMDSIRWKPYLIGGSLWTFNDYRSRFSGTKEFSENRPWGIVDVFRQKKEAWYSFRREYAPVRDVKIEMNGNDNSSAQLTIIPRKFLDIPAYPLKDYVLVWAGYDGKNKIRQSGLIKLPEILPGGLAFSKTINWDKDLKLSNLKVEIVSSLNYSVYDTTVFFQPPTPPLIKFTYGGRTSANDLGASGSIRVVFKRDQPQVHYKVKFGVESLSNETAPTLNSFIDIPNLSFGAVYQVAVVGINAKGEGQPSEIKKVTLETGLAPPVIYYVEPADKGFFVGYATANNDYLFKVQYTTTRGGYANASTIQSPTKGVLFVPGLVNGQRYFFRISRTIDNNYHTDWSEEYSVTPDGLQLPPVPIIQGVIRDDKDAIIVFEPVRKAIGYAIQYRIKNAGEWITLQLNAAQLRHCRISGLNQNDLYEFRIASKNEYGQSRFTEAFLQ